MPNPFDNDEDPELAFHFRNSEDKFSDEETDEEDVIGCIKPSDIIDKLRDWVRSNESFPPIIKKHAQQFCADFSFNGCMFVCDKNFKGITLVEGFTIMKEIFNESFTNTPSSEQAFINGVELIRYAAMWKMLKEINMR